MTNTRLYTLVERLALAVGLLALPSGARADNITFIDKVGANGYTFVNFDGPGPGLFGTTVNGISNNGTVVGFVNNFDVSLINFTAAPPRSMSATRLKLTDTAMANGINSAGTVVGFDGNDNAFTLPAGGSAQTLLPAANAPAVAFGINDQGTIVGQYTTNGQTPGFLLKGSSLYRLDAPGGPDLVNAQGINNHGRVVGFYVGTDGQDHGFLADVKDVRGGQLSGTAIADPTIPLVPGEPGASFVFSQLLGINDSGFAVGYYGDSTGSQHGFLYNTQTGHYTFLDDPDQQFNSAGVEVTQITGINDAGEIAGFYQDLNGVPHGFVASANGFAVPPTAAVPEASSVILLASGVLIAGVYRHRRVRGAS